MDSDISPNDFHTMKERTEKILIELEPTPIQRATIFHSFL